MSGNSSACISRQQFIPPTGLNESELNLARLLVTPGNSIPVDYSAQIKEIVSDELLPVLQVRLEDITECPDLQPVFDQLPSLAVLLISFQRSAGYIANLHRPGLTLPNCRTISHGLSLSQNLIQLSLTSCSIDDPLLLTLFEGLVHCSPLVFLDLSRNEIGDKGAFAISTLLTDSYCISEIILDSNHIGDAGVIAIASKLNTCDTLEHLSLSMNYCADEGGIALFQSLTLNTSLLECNFRCNRLTSRTLPFITACISENQTLTQLELSGNSLGADITPEHLLLFKHCVESNKSLNRLNVDDCGIL